jgi:hypothetical protein
MPVSAAIVGIVARLAREHRNFGRCSAPQGTSGTYLWSSSPRSELSNSTDQGFDRLPCPEVVKPDSLMFLTFRHARFHFVVGRCAMNNIHYCGVTSRGMYGCIGPPAAFPAKDKNCQDSHLNEWPVGSALPSGRAMCDQACQPMLHQFVTHARNFIGQDCGGAHLLNAPQTPNISRSLRSSAGGLPLPNPF